MVKFEQTLGTEAAILIVFVEKNIETWIYVSFWSHSPSWKSSAEFNSFFFHTLNIYQDSQLKNNKEILRVWCSPQQSTLATKMLPVTEWSKKL